MTNGLKVLFARLALLICFNPQLPLIFIPGNTEAADMLKEVKREDTINGSLSYLDMRFSRVEFIASTSVEQIHSLDNQLMAIFSEREASDALASSLG